MRKQGFKNVDGYYGPYLPGQSPQEQAAAAAGSTTPAAAPLAVNTPATKDKNGWFTPEMKGQLFGTILNLGSQLAQSKINGQNNTAPGMMQAGNPTPTTKTGLSTPVIIGGVVFSALLIGGIVYFVRHKK